MASPDLPFVLVDDLNEIERYQKASRTKRPLEVDEASAVQPPRTFDLPLKRSPGVLPVSNADALAVQMQSILNKVELLRKWIMEDGPEPTSITDPLRHVLKSPEKPKAKARQFDSRDIAEASNLLNATLNSNDDQFVSMVYNPESMRYIPQDEAIKTILEGLKNGVEAQNAIATPRQMAVTGVNLLEHQRVGLKWLVSQEASFKFRGGILGDEMGLGKTVQIIALLTHSHDPNKHQPTLIVGPVAVLQQWAEELRTKTILFPKSVLVYHGDGRKRFAMRLRNFSIVITSYAILSMEFSEDFDKPDGPLFQIEWHRVVLDEAHAIKNRNTRAAKAACQLRAIHRWCLSGTPIQNSLDDMYSLFRFLRVQPYCNLDYFREHVVKNGKNCGPKDLAKLQAIIRGIMLRRDKSIIKLPQRIISFCTAPFSGSDKGFYDALESQSRSQFNDYVRAGTVINNYTNILVLLLRLRQACDHRSLIPHSNLNTITPAPKQDQVVLPKDVLQRLTTPNQIAECSICLDAEIENPVTTRCGHIFCEQCIHDWINNDGAQSKCPNCRQVIKESELIAMGEIHATSAVKSTPSYYGSSTKIDLLLAELREIRDKDRNAKTIVFSQFTKFLDVIEPFLNDNGLLFTRYDGTMSLKKKTEALEIFRLTDRHILLMSLKCGALGLNLSFASNVLILDPWWNPSIEDQAIDRAHRIGQQKDVNVRRLTISGTVEDRIITLQENKRKLAAGALGEEALVGLNRLSETDLKFLFAS